MPKKAPKAASKKKTSKKVSKPRTTTHKEKLLDALKCGNVVEDLASEMGDWRDNLESNSMEHLPKYEEVSEAADTLENAGQEIESSVDELRAALEEIKELNGEIVGSIEISYTEHSRRGSPRWLRRDNAVAPLRAAVDYIENALIDGEQSKNEALDNIEELTASLADRLDEIEGVEFPGMF
jgi:hypothetical protein